MNETIDKFIDELKKALSDKTFVKLTLSNYKGEDKHLQKISIRSVEIKKGTRLLFQYQRETNDIVKNFEYSESVETVKSYLINGFRSAHLFTVEHDIQLTVGKRNSRMTIGKPTKAQDKSATHDRLKNYRIDPSAYYLRSLGITTDKGEIKASQQDKWRQINKFVEILEGLIENSELKDRKTLKIVDMGSGKGYLTFAAYDLLTGQNATVRESVEMIGVEQRSDLVNLCDQIARAGNFDGLRFVNHTIADFELGDVDILIALHACDTATDDALFKGIAAKASIIIAAPCCHKEVRKQMTPPEILSGILKYGVMLERTAETITDGLRALILEREGYSTKLFEFVPTEHTPKNNMLAATKGITSSRSKQAGEQVESIIEHFSIGTQRLQLLLESEPK